MKDEFVALISHELRTPLTSIRGYVELLREDLPNTPLEQQEKFLSVVERNADRLLSLVNDLLFMAQIEVGKVELNRVETDLVLLAEECVAAARPVAEERQIEVRIDAQARPVLSADRARLAQVLDNLLSNALKFTPPRGEIEIRIAAGEGTASLEMSDTGMGISAEDQTHLFSSFFRSSSANAAAIPGTGLGLSISKGIVEAHGGEISVQSREGHGSMFRIVLPASGALPAREPRHGSRFLALAVPVVGGAATAHDQVVSLVTRPDAQLVAVGIDRDRGLDHRRDHQYAGGFRAWVRHLVRAFGTDREADDLAALELLLAFGVA